MAARRRLSLPLLAGVLALVSAQQITFGTEKQCEVNGAPGTCLRFRDCPENVAHHRNRNIAALRAALRACGSRKPPAPMCCPAMSQGILETTARFRNHRLCGTSSFQPGRIVGGEPVRSLSDFPWMVALKWRPEGSRPAYRCGGAIINERWVLTAAHCLTEGAPVTVRVRDLDLGRTTDDYLRSPPEDVRVERSFSHPDYRRVYRWPNAGVFSDVGLLKLEKDLAFSDLSRPLCLPEKLRPRAKYEQLRRSYIAGWGLTEFGGVASPAMLWAGVNITNHNACQTAYSRLRSASVEDDEHICANGNDPKQPGCDPAAGDGSCRGGVDACEGDSGGPLMMRMEGGNRQHWEAIGVISFGNGCGNPDSPGIYTRVDHFMEWIAKTVNDN